MKSKDKCVFTEEVKQKVYCLYRESNLAVLEYIAEITKTWNDDAKEFLNKYDVAEDENEEVEIFWEQWNITDFLIISRNKKVNCKKKHEFYP